MDYETFRSHLGEGFHTALRKAGGSEEATRAWSAIRQMNREEWRGVVNFVAEPVWGYLLTDPPVDAAPQGDM
jgi:hypothetical protein